MTCVKGINNRNKVDENAKEEKIQWAGKTDKKRAPKCIYTIKKLLAFLLSYEFQRFLG